MKNPICRAFGHKTLCTAEATLPTTGGAILHHTHECLRCKRVHRFHDEYLSPDWEQLLRWESQNTGYPVTINLQSDFAHKATFQR